MVSWIPRNTCSLTPLARCCFKSSIWMWFSGSRYGNLLRIERSSNGLSFQELAMIRHGEQGLDRVVMLPANAFEDRLS